MRDGRPLKVRKHPRSPGREGVTCQKVTLSRWLGFLSRKTSIIVVLFDKSIYHLSNAILCQRDERW